MTTIPDEESPLLNNGQPTTSVKTPHTPLPLGQFSIVLFLQLAEPLTAQVIYVSKIFISIYQVLTDVIQ